MSIHSKFLIHWTGKDFHVPPTSPITSDIRKQYVERLIDDCYSGMYMNIGQEVIYGVGGTSITDSISRICFSEVRLSQVEYHAKHYGMLGIGFQRDFVIQRQGNPVFYVQNSDEGLVIENLDHVTKYLQANAKNIKLYGEFAVVCGFLKAMSERNKSDYTFYEEMEWRIVHTNRLQEKNYCYVQDKNLHIYRLKVSPKDIRIIIFPDDDTKQMAIKDKDNRFIKFFKDDFPIITTVEDCKNF